jgi:putative spermidine/putrescine transport system substrate-binding protein
MRRLALAGMLAATMALPAVADTADGSVLIGADWDSIVGMARGGEVNWFMWGGADSINAYVSDHIGGILARDYDITLNRIPLADTVEAVNIVLGE